MSDLVSAAGVKAAIKAHLVFHSHRSNAFVDVQLMPGEKQPVYVITIEASLPPPVRALLEDRLGRKCDYYVFVTPHPCLRMGATAVGSMLASQTGMDDEQRRRWKVKDTLFAEWRELPGEFTAQEIWEMRVKGVFWIAIPIHEDAEDSTPKPSD